MNEKDVAWQNAMCPLRKRHPITCCMLCDILTLENAYAGSILCTNAHACLQLHASNESIRCIYKLFMYVLARTQQQ